MDFRVRDRPITLEGFLKEYYSTLSKIDFIKYFEARSKERWGKRIITDLTYKHGKMVLVKVKVFKPEILFREFNNEWAQNFDLQLKKDLATNSR